MPGWLEVHKSGHRTLVGRFVGTHGSARPIAVVNVEGDDFTFAIPPQWERGDQDLTVHGWIKGDGLVGTIQFPRRHVVQLDGRAGALAAAGRAAGLG